MIRRSIVLVCTLIASAVAQTEVPARGIQIRLLAFAHSGKIDRLQLRDGARDAGTFELPTQHFSDPVEVGSHSIDFGIPAKEFQPLGQISLPDSGKRFVVIFAPTAQGYRVFPVRTDDPDFRGDDALIFNFSPFDVGVSLGTAKQLVPKMKTGRLRPVVPPGATFFQATFFQQAKDGMKIFNDTRWPANNRLRVFAFVFQDPASGRMTYRDLRDMVP